MVQSRNGGSKHKWHVETEIRPLEPKLPLGFEPVLVLPQLIDTGMQPSPRRKPTSWHSIFAVHHVASGHNS